MTPEAVRLLGAGLAIGLGAIGPGIGIGIIGFGHCRPWDEILRPGV